MRCCGDPDGLAQLAQLRALRAPRAHRAPLTGVGDLGLQGLVHFYAAPAAAAAAAPAGSLPLPPAAASGGNVLALIAARRLMRRFAPTPLAQGALAGVLAAITAPRSPPLLSAAVQVYGVVNAVVGLAPGAYRCESGPHTLGPRRANTDLRATAQAAAFDQDAVGGAAAVFVLALVAIDPDRE